MLQDSNIQLYQKYDILLTSYIAQKQYVFSTQSSMFLGQISE